MKLRGNWPLLLLLTTCLILGIRLAWILSSSPTGLATHVRLWTGGAGDIVGIERTQLSERAPRAQAEYWLQQVKAIDATRHDPQIAMGAAWMLDTPQYSFTKNHIRMNGEYGLSMLGIREFDADAIASLTDEFETLCRSERQARIETAIHLDTSNAELWRARALMLFHNEFMDTCTKPRQADWQTILDQCAAHDTDNALYDYLAASYLLSSSTETGWEDDHYTLKVNNEEAFKQGNAYFAAGLNKPFFQSGDEGFASTLAFLEASSLVRTDYVLTAGSRVIISRAKVLLYSLLRRQDVQIDLYQQAGNFDAAVAAARSTLVIAEQVSPAGNHPDLAQSKLHLRRSGWANLKELYEDQPHLFNEQEQTQIAEELAKVRLDLSILNEAVGHLSAEVANTTVSLPELVAGSQGIPTYLVALFVTVVVQSFIMATLILAILGLLLAAVSGKAARSERFEMGCSRHVAAWLVGLAASIVLFGLFPTEIVSPEVQTWLVRGLLWLLFALPTLGLLHFFHRRFEVPWYQLIVLAGLALASMAAPFRFSETMELATGRVANMELATITLLLLLLMLLCWITYRVLIAFVRNQRIPQRSKWAALFLVSLVALVVVPASSGFATVLSHKLRTRSWIQSVVWQEVQFALQLSRALPGTQPLVHSPWSWVMVEWTLHHGAILATLISVGILLVWQLVRQIRRLEGGLRQLLRSQKRSFMRLAGMTTAKSCLTVSLISLTVYLLVTPITIDALDTYHRVHIRRMKDPASTWDQIATLTAELRSDPAVVARLKAALAEEDRVLAEQERMFAKPTSEKK